MNMLRYSPSSCVHTVQPLYNDSILGQNLTGRCVEVAIVGIDRKVSIRVKSVDWCTVGTKIHCRFGKVSVIES